MSSSMRSPTRETHALPIRPPRLISATGITMWKQLWIAPKCRYKIKMKIWKIQHFTLLLLYFRFQDSFWSGSHCWSPGAAHVAVWLPDRVTLFALPSTERLPNRRHCHSLLRTRTLHECRGENNSLPSFVFVARLFIHWNNHNIIGKYKWWYYHCLFFISLTILYG